MNVSRRKFFGAAAASTIAAKQAAAKSVLAFEAQSASNLAAPVSSLGVPDLPADDGWIKQELRSLIEQRKSWTEAPAPSAGDSQSAIRIDGMRSLSPSTRARMIHEDRDRRAREANLTYIDKRIKKLKEKLGPLGGLFE